MLPVEICLWSTLPARAMHGNSPKVPANKA